MFVCLQLQALAKDAPWKLKESGVLEIVQAVSNWTIFNALIEQSFLHSAITSDSSFNFFFVENLLVLNELTNISSAVYWRNLLNQIDDNTDGLVDFTEFVAAALHVYQLHDQDAQKWQQRSQTAFEKLDIDKDGYITPEELKLVSETSLFTPVIV